jgi:signal transduction histidine kinase
MRERAEAVGGRFSVASAPGEGTHVSAWVPLDRSALGQP